MQSNRCFFGRSPIKKQTQTKTKNFIINHSNCSAVTDAIQCKDINMDTELVNFVLSIFVTTSRQEI